MISKELLSEVYGKSITGINISNGIVYHTDDLLPFNTYNINIHELAHKVKEWAMNEYDISIHEFLCPDNSWTWEVWTQKKSEGWSCDDWFNKQSPIECAEALYQWILENR